MLEVAVLCTRTLLAGVLAVSGAAKLADFIEEAADVYERRGLFTYRF